VVTVMPWLLYPMTHPEPIVQTEAILHSTCYTSVNNSMVFIILATFFFLGNYHANRPPHYMTICFNHKYIYMHTYVLYIRFKLPLINWSHYSLLNAFNHYLTRDGGWGMNCNLSSWFTKNTVLFEQKKKKKSNKWIWWKITHSLCSTCYRGLKQQ